ncbi:hypothetical protein GWI33_015752 [Rhynchophorus ferrugineus]|uniref:Uncharacterized protein n=1 Tax=Rhynchophorus ferrugineus TaxID=354439 RepID=A0A834HYM4_RHYFE|nr:hypothetical protein GWI33_015752 [Rhynchophorus ferrugineus]
MPRADICNSPSRPRAALAGPIPVPLSPGAGAKGVDNGYVVSSLAAAEMDSNGHVLRCRFKLSADTNLKRIRAELFMGGEFSIESFMERRKLLRGRGPWGSKGDGAGPNGERGRACDANSIRRIPKKRQYKF